MMSPPSWEVRNTVILYYPPRKVFSLAGGLSSKAMHGPTLDIVGESMVSVPEMNELAACSPCATQSAAQVGAPPCADVLLMHR